MEVIDDEKPKNWTSFVNKFRKSKTRPIVSSESDDMFKEENEIYENDQPILQVQPIIDENYKAVSEDLLKFDENDKSINKVQQRNDDNQESSIDEQSKISQKFGFIKDPKPIDEDVQKRKIERCISIIKKLHQKEVGSFSRLESISNYLTEGQQLLYEDERYVREQYKKLDENFDLDEDFDYEKRSVPNKDASEPQTILIDDVEENPTDDFTSLGITIAKIIKDSTPHFTIGIYGEWGTGKTTLMKAIEKNLSTEGIPKDEQKILPVWFNAWQYDREEHLATISLMKTVAYEMAGHKRFDGISKTILKGLTILGKDITQNLIQEIVSKGGFDNENELEEKINHLNELYRDSIYFDGLKKIKSQMEQIRKSSGKDSRVVIFIDDLDRCSPDKALEILESIKLFLGME
ncbi:MAG: KAP family P-loop NTPase fold protein, partial [Nitrosopumilaceae archaeon]